MDCSVSFICYFCDVWINFIRNCLWNTTISLLCYSVKFLWPKVIIFSNKPDIPHQNQIYRFRYTPSQFQLCSFFVTVPYLLHWLSTKQVHFLWWVQADSYYYLSIFCILLALRFDHLHLFHLSLSPRATCIPEMCWSILKHQTNSQLLHSATKLNNQAHIQMIFIHLSTNCLKLSG